VADAVALAVALALVLALALGATEEAALMGTALDPALADALGDADVCCARAADANSIAPSTESPINNNTFLTFSSSGSLSGCRLAPWGGTLADPRSAGHPPYGLSLVLLRSCLG
jgi:hypothetical protein